MSDDVDETIRGRVGRTNTPTTNDDVPSTDISRTVIEHTSDIAAATVAPKSPKFAGDLLSMITRSSTKSNADEVRVPGDDGGGRGSKVPKIINVASRARREEARRRLELYEVFPMAAEWGGLTLATLLNHGLLERRETISAISAEATASALLRQTLEVTLVLCLWNCFTYS